MRATLADGLQVRIVFHHTEFATPVPYTRQSANERHAGEVVDIISDTVCWIVRDEPGKTSETSEKLAEGHSRRSVLDPAEPAEVRRQRALHRAVAPFDRYDRGVLLKAYFDRPKRKGLRPNTTTTSRGLTPQA